MRFLWLLVHIYCFQVVNLRLHHLCLSRNGIALHNVRQHRWTETAHKPVHQGTMEPEDELSSNQDLMSNQGLLPSTSTSLLNCTFLV